MRLERKVNLDSTPPSYPPPVTVYGNNPRFYSPQARAKIRDIRDPGGVDWGAAAIAHAADEEAGFDLDHIEVTFNCGVYAVFARFNAVLRCHGTSDPQVPPLVVVTTVYGHTAYGLLYLEVILKSLPLCPYMVIITSSPPFLIT